MAGQQLSRYYCCVNLDGCLEFWTRDAPGMVALDVEQELASPAAPGEAKCVFVLEVAPDLSLTFIHADRFVASMPKFIDARHKPPVRQHAGPCPACEEDGAGYPMPGILWKPGDRHVERCDGCGRYGGDLDAAHAVAHTFNLFATLVPDPSATQPGEEWVGDAVVLPREHALRIDFDPPWKSEAAEALLEAGITPGRLLQVARSADGKSVAGDANDDFVDLDAFDYPILGDHLEQRFLVRYIASITIGARIDSAEELRTVLTRNFIDYLETSDELEILSCDEPESSHLPPAPGDLVTHRHHFFSRIEINAFRRGIEAAGGACGEVGKQPDDFGASGGYYVDIQGPPPARDVRDLVPEGPPGVFNHRH